jgi:CubicO group peptidase (beta-lactamase class C family)
MRRTFRVRRVLRWALVGALAAVGVAVAASLLAYPPTYVYRVLAWRSSDAFDWQKFPAHPLRPSPVPRPFPRVPDPAVGETFARLAGAADWETYLAEHQTQAFLVVRDGVVVDEHYLNGTRRDDIVTSFSVAKSFVSTLVGIAVAQGAIRSIDDPVTAYVPELLDRDPRFAAITVGDLLRMSSGLRYRAFRPLVLNGDDPLTTYFPDQRALALQHPRYLEAPGLHFSYNKLHPQLLGLILERTTRMSVTQFLQTALWDPVGMEYAGSWSTDSLASDFEKMETGINARAVDFAKLGQLYLDGGRAGGAQVLPEAWVQEATQPYVPTSQDYYGPYFQTLPGHAYYGLMWWGIAREDGTYDFAAEGDKGQFIYVAPSRRLVIVRNGTEFGLPTSSWLRLFYDFAGAA